MSDHVPPHDEEAEYAVVGSVLHGGRDVLTEIGDLVDAEDFYIERLRRVFEAAVAVDNRDQPIDVVLIKDEIGGNSPDWIFTTLDDAMKAPTAIETAPHYARIVRAKSQLRATINAATEILLEARNPTGDPAEIVDLAEQKILGVRKTAASETHDVRALVADVVRDLADGALGGEGIATGIDALDEKLLGVRGGEFVIVAARPSMGKSSLALTVAANIAEGGKDALVFSLEVGRHQVASNILAARGQINTSHLRGRLLHDEEMNRAQSVSHDLGRASHSVIVNDKAGISLPELRAIARRTAARRDLGVIVIDYVGLMAGDRSARRDGRQQEISDISQGLKSLARELDIPVIALAQLNRQVESREDKRPRLSDLRDSGSLEQDADVVVMLYRESYYNRSIGPDREGLTEIHIPKNRNGPIGVVKVWFAKQYLRFTDTHAKPSYGQD